ISALACLHMEMKAALEYLAAFGAGFAGRGCGVTAGVVLEANIHRVNSTAREGAIRFHDLANRLIERYRANALALRHETADLDLANPSAIRNPLELNPRLRHSGTP